MRSNLLNTGLLFVMSTMFLACNEDDSSINNSHREVNDIDVKFNVPSTYVFERENVSTVSFGGQTTRLSMAKEILEYLAIDSGKSEQDLEAAFAHMAGDDDFSSTELNESSKSVKSKVAASDDLFGSDALAKEAIQALMSGFLKRHVTEVVPNILIEAAPGVAGFVGSRYVSAKGLEYNQAFNKGLIGALIVDQVLNNYLGNNRILNDGYITDNSSETLESGKNYTKYEHHFDEAYGYVYGDASVDGESPITTEGDKFLFKYIAKVNGDSDFSGIQDQIFKAFKLGRSAVVAKEYDVLRDAIEILQYQISKVIGVRAVHYLQAGKEDLASEAYASALHGLSEGYGFIYSLQFTRNPETDAPYFTSSEVNAMIAKLENGNGFWDLADGVVLDEISNQISAKFDFTTAQAAE
ncbi:DUF4856 domain-containing protein [Flavicella sp.]|nr:DUF4856 domain-containing protein [Flavicella sp.]MDA9111345.1 DUF4856 domain-containing protein [Flavicella sp.]